MKTKTPYLPDLIANSGISRFKTSRKQYWKTLKELAREMRINPTRSEKLIWEELRNKKLGVRFRRQHIIDQFIVDFVCLSKKIIIEIDGNIHNDRKIQDFQRTEILNSLGFEIFRFHNEEVIHCIDKVLTEIKLKIDNI